jgi:hypothetical protein
MRNLQRREVEKTRLSALRREALANQKKAGTLALNAPACLH